MAATSFPDTVRVASYNICAPEYNHYLTSNPFFQGRPFVIDPASDQRFQALAAKIASLGDVVCLQEVSKAHYSRLEAFLKLRGYEGTFAPNALASRSDGVATFYKRDVVQVEPRSTVIHYYRHPQDSSQQTLDTTGKAALVQVFRTHSGQTFTVCNTHLEGGQARPTGDKESQIRQLPGLLSHRPAPVMVCGDFNTTWKDPFAAKYFSGAVSPIGFDALQHRDAPSTVIGAQGTPIRLDYILSAAHPLSIDVLGNLSELMTANEPSDHLPVVAVFPLTAPVTARTPAQAPVAPGLLCRNMQPGTDAQPSLQRWLFNEFNRSSTENHFSQADYDRLAHLLEQGLAEASSKITYDMPQDMFVQYVASALLYHATNQADFEFLHDFLNVQIPFTQKTDPVFVPFNQLPTGTYRCALMDVFNQRYLDGFGQRPFLWKNLASCFELIITRADQAVQSGATKNCFLDACLEQAQIEAPQIHLPFFELVFRTQALATLSRVQDLLSKGQFQQAQKLFKLIPRSMLNEVFGQTYHLAKAAGLNTNHADFGRVAFCKDSGWDVPDPLRTQAVQKVLLTEIAKLFSSNCAKDAFALFAKLPIAIQHQIYGRIYEIEKAAGRDTGHADFGHVAFHNQAGKSVSNAVRAQALADVCGKL
jgi:endonuclease/exonuclease/phosphatase family metal-dependent hydrolase